MISNGQMVVRKGMSYLGAEEGPPNRSGDPVVDECQKQYGLSGVPWCACWCGYVVKQSGAKAAYVKDALSVIHPSTAEMVARAKRRKWYGPHGRATRPGDMFIIAGRHVGLINAVNKDGRTFVTVEGNAANGVRSYTRAWSDGWMVIHVPGVGDPGPASTVDGYGFDDTRVNLYGGWPNAKVRDKMLAKFVAAHPDHWAQAVRVERPSPYAFRAGPEGTWGHYTFGPWLQRTGKDRRDAEMEIWQKANRGATARPWKRTYKEP